MSENFALLRTLSESRLIPAQRSLKGYDPEELAELAYLYIISLRIMLAEDDTRNWTESYCQKTARGSNFTKWRTDGTDLYVLLHSLADDTEDIGDDKEDADYFRDRINIYPAMIYRWIVAGSHGRQSESDTKRLFVRLDSMFRIKNGSMRAIRRLVQDWPDLDEKDCRLAMTRLLQFMRSRASRGELTPYLNRLSHIRRLELHDVSNPEEDGDFSDDDVKIGSHDRGAEGKPAPKHSFLRTLATVGAGALTGALVTRSLSGRRHTKESASADASCAANVASSIGGIGAGFDDDYSKSAYPPPKKRAKDTIIRRIPVKNVSITPP